MMPPFAYALLAGLVIGFGGGVTIGYKWNEAELTACNAAIERGNIIAQNVLDAAVAQKSLDESKAQQLNQQIEVSHAQAVSTVNALSDRAADAARRLYSVRNQGCTNALPSSSGAGGIEEAAADGFSQEVRKTIYDIGVADAYAQACWQFVTNNCGIIYHALLPN
jgi:hypothetical protein